MSLIAQGSQWSDREALGIRNKRENSTFHKAHVGSFMLSRRDDGLSPCPPSCPKVPLTKWEEFKEMRESRGF